ncbi:hypothetical protein acdb102_49500 [Acidothermaceae bacterium B102]|nr:hypothetical protein acdb102_49500 [Acidothermaceae bacterium B102]
MTHTVGTLSNKTKLGMTGMVRAGVIAALSAVVAALLPWGGSPASGAGLAFTYTSIKPVPIGTNEAQSIVVGGQLYLFGGFDVTKTTFTPTSRAWRYDPDANTWTALATMPVNGITHSGIATDGVRYVYYAGGSASADNATQQVFGSTDAFMYDTVANTYTRLPSLPAPRMGGGLGYVGGKLYYFGGNNITRTQDTGDTWMLDLSGGATSWVAEAPMPDPRNHIGFATQNGLIYAVGGQHLDKSSTAQGELDSYDPATNVWTVLPAMPLPRGHVMDSTFFLDGDLVVAAGWTTSNVSAAVLAYDPVAQTWTAWPNLPEARTSTTVKGVSGGRFVYCCGSAGTSSATGWIATPSVPPVTTPPGSPTVTATPQPQPDPTPTTAPPTTVPPTTPAPTTVPPTTAPPTTAPPTTAPPTTPPVSSTPPPSSSPPPAPKLTLTAVAVHPSTAVASAGGSALVSYKLSHAAKVTLVLEQCNATTCPQVGRDTVSAPAGTSHVSLHALTGREKLVVAHYRIVVSAPGVASVTLHFVVVAG